MSIAPRLPDEHQFHLDAALRTKIRDALDSSDPAATLRESFPWIAASTRLRFVLEARRSEGVDLEVLINRFEHAVRVEWLDQQDLGERWLSRLRRELAYRLRRRRARHRVVS